MLGCEPYVSGNVGSGTVEELAKWVEYMTSEGDSPMARLRRQNGRDKAWKVKYLGVGNESWGCGGSMRPEYYADLYRRYSTYCWALGKCREVEDVIRRHCAIMDKYDPKKQIALMLDEWGTWWDEEPGTIAGHLYQQNSLRDAFVASLSLDIFHKYTDRLKMANIAQVVNVLQSMILTKDDRMVLTPTYYVFKMYRVHQDATYLPLELDCATVDVRDGRRLPLLSATASRDKEGRVHISLSNVDLNEAQEVTVHLPGITARKAVGEVLTAEHVTDCNTFDQPDRVRPVPFKDTKIEKGVLRLTLPAKSIVTLELQ